MTIKTPTELADEAFNAWAVAEYAKNPRSTAPFDVTDDVLTIIVAAIEADHAQRPQIHADWRDDQENVRDAHHVTVSWLACDHHGGILFSSDMKLTASLAVGMFEGIGQAEAQGAAERIATLASAWEDATGDAASDYTLSEDDWRVGLDDDEAAEIVRLIEWTTEASA